MTETVVHVTTLSQWHNVLDIWFGQGYSWNTGSREYKDIFSRMGLQGIYKRSQIIQLLTQVSPPIQPQHN